jgi:hypothetical protein
MANAITSERDQTAPSDNARVFNDETCRAIRYQTRGLGRMLVVAGIFFVGVFITLVAEILTLPPLVDVALPVVGAVATSAVCVVVMRRFDIMPNHAALQELKSELYHDLLELGEEIRNPETKDDPPPRPELAFGLPPEDCFMVFVPAVLGLFLAPQVTDLLLSTLILVGGIALSGVLFVLAKRSDMNTYPPEEPP